MALRRFAHQEVKELHEYLLSEYDFTPAERRAMEVGLIALENALTAQYEIDNEGMLIQGGPKGENLVANPAVNMARQERAQFLAMCKLLGIADPYGGEGPGVQGKGAQRTRRG
jgi:hypothetical protein